MENIMTSRHSITTPFFTVIAIIAAVSGMFIGSVHDPLGLIENQLN